MTQNPSSGWLCTCIMLTSLCENACAGAQGLGLRCRGDFLDVGQKIPQVPLPPELTLLYEDDELIVVLKANGLLTAATPANRAAFSAYIGEKR